MIDLEIMQDASEMIHYDTQEIPYAIQERCLSQFTDMRALCHWHEEIECIHVFQGKMNYDVNGKKILLQAGDSIVVNSHQLHFGYDYKQEECEFAVILFHPSILDSNLHTYQKMVSPIINSSAEPYWHFSQNHSGILEITRLLQQIFALRGDRKHSEYLLLGLIHCLWHTIFRYSDHSLYKHAVLEHPDVHLQKQMVSYVHQHYSENIELEDIASSGNISRSKCCKIFQKYLQQSPVAFLNAYRMEISCNLLKDTSFSITQIAISCGYNHPSYFSKMFMRKYGCTPNQYRKAYGHSGK
ncbi:MAG: AraC family transcriptional regulator [Lachnospiraceae bacterium]|nr:AraC family transcriptional regulator [Lachnospiraceae bacterium]